MLSEWVYNNNLKKKEEKKLSRKTEKFYAFIVLFCFNTGANNLITDI